MHRPKQIAPFCWQLPRSGAMRVPGIIYASEAMMADPHQAEPIRQVANVASLPGIVGPALAMPDMHWGYGFPIGGVAAFDWQDGVISPGGVGYDINCGVRLAGTALDADDVSDRIGPLLDTLHRTIPTGVGSSGAITLSAKNLRHVLTRGSRWAVEHGLGDSADLTRTEDGGCMVGADPDAVSDRAIARGRNQLGTLGSGNHFVEIDVVDTIFDSTIADTFGLSEGMITVMIHSGSRGLGYQVCDDFLARMVRASHSAGIELPDRQLACAPIQSTDGKRYLSAMACAANYAWANRQALLHQTRDAFMSTLGIGPSALDMRLVYDVSHNIAKRERHVLHGREQEVCVHRKGATRSFAADHPDLPPDLAAVGQPVVIPGDMGRASYVLAGTARAMTDTFGSTCHGAGRVLSRTAAKRRSRGRRIDQELAKQGIQVRWTGRTTLAEEMPEAYKDVSEVVKIVNGAGLSKMVAKLRPLGVIKG